MHAQRGNELGTGTADEHSWTLMSLHEMNVAITAGLGNHSSATSW
jgi:hypothetical protein